MENKRPNKDTITIRLGVANKPLHNIYRELAAEKKMSTNRYIENILVAHIENLGITWEEPEEEAPAPPQLEEVDPNQLTIHVVIEEEEAKDG